MSLILQEPAVWIQDQLCRSRECSVEPRSVDSCKPKEAWDVGRRSSNWHVVLSLKLAVFIISATLLLWHLPKFFKFPLESAEPGTSEISWYYPISCLVVETPDLNFKLPLGSAAPGTCQRKHLYITWWLSYLCTWPKILKWLLQQLSSGPVKICNPMLALDCTYLWKKQLLWNWFFSGTRASCPLNLLRRNVYVTRCLYWAALTLD
jgi:hypothetical protein